MPYAGWLIKLGWLGTWVSEPACFGAAPAPGNFYPEPAPVVSVAEPVLFGRSRCEDVKAKNLLTTF